MKDQQLWLQLLQLSNNVRESTEGFSYIFCSKEKVLFDTIPLVFDASGFIVSLEDKLSSTNEYPIFKLSDFIKIISSNTDRFSPTKIKLLKLYLPYCFLSYHAKKIGRCISITHFAQTLDGKIATTQGDACWIGNEENLDHAHRMRALCDSILVGNNTVRNDQPSLTVRRVAGRNPKRIIVGSSEVDLTSLLDCCPKPILVVSNAANYEMSQVEHLRVPSDNCRMDSAAILKSLFEKGIHSVYIEGGALTTSNFLKDKAVDILQLHIAPLLFGSGKQGVVLPEIQKVKDSQSFQCFEFYKIGDAMMFVGSL